MTERKISANSARLQQLSAYDDLMDTLAYQGHQLDPALWDDLVDRLAVYDVTYLGGGSADAGRPAPYDGPADADLSLLILDLASAPEPRLRDALIALLLRHPEHAGVVRLVMSALPPSSGTWMSLLARLLVAAALQREHQALRGHISFIQVGDLVSTYSLPLPEEQSGRALLEAVQSLMRARLKSVDYIDGWEDVARHTLRELLGVVAFEHVMIRGE